MIDLSGLLSGKFEELSVDENCSLEKAGRAGEEILFSEPVRVIGKLKRMEANVIFFTGVIETEVETVCARCLTEVREPIRIRFDEAVYAKGREEDFDLIVEPDAETLDLDLFADNLLELKLPMKFLCSEDCKGLCPVCGANRNTSDCRCSEEQIDPRFAKLKELIIDEEKHE